MNIRKKSAGRPPKALSRKLDQRKGILSQPINPNSIYELTHDNPDMFKSLFEASRKVNDTIKIIVTPEGTNLIFESKNGGCFAITEIYGAKVIGYYCAEKKVYSCMADNIIKILKNKKKNHEKITFAIYNNDPYYMNVILSSATKIDENYKVPIDKTTDINLSNYDKSYLQYPLNFTLEWSYFKETMNSWKNFTNSGIIFEKDEGPLKISFSDGINTCDIVFGDDNNIKMNYDSDSLIAISVPITNLLNCSPCDSISNFITFHIKEKNLLVLTAKVDEVYEDKKTTYPNSESALIRYYLTLSK